MKRGSYEYDEIDDERRIVPKEVDKRFFSEMLYDVQVATDSNLGHNVGVVNDKKTPFIGRKMKGFFNVFKRFFLKKKRIV